MPQRLRFGIPSFDKLFGEGQETETANSSSRNYGILIPGSNEDTTLRSSISICMSGPDGTGKTIMGLHLASTYLADCYYRKKDNEKNKKKIKVAIPKIFYVSTDLKHKMAEKVWLNFGLDRPEKRQVPFIEERRELHNSKPRQSSASDIKIKLQLCSPFGELDDTARSLAHHLSLPTGNPTHKDNAEVLFVDLASTTAGDDWGFINRLLSVLESPAPGQPLHLLIIDSVEGFETLAGERDAFGETQERRSRIAQIMRSAADKCQIMLIVEEPEKGKRLPEDFVTDVVIRLRSLFVRDYARRTLEIEKARGHSHVRGQHPYLIRSGAGSTTGGQGNPDEPALPFTGRFWSQGKPERAAYQSYVHVCPSIHRLNRGVMNLRDKGRPASLPKRFAAFGIRHLDDMLDGEKMNYARKAGDDQRGLKCGTTTALIGNADTQKSPLGYAFLSRCFREYANRFKDEIEGLKSDTTERNKVIEEAKEKVKGWSILRKARPPKTNEERLAEVLCRLDEVYVYADVEGKYIDKEPSSSPPSEATPPNVGDLIKAAVWKLGAPKFESDGVPVLLTTQDINAEELAYNFLPWLTRKVPALQIWNRGDDPQYRGCLAALRLLMEHFTICRRLEIHDLPLAVFFHIVQSAVGAAQSILHKKVPVKTEERFKKSWGIRVVIDDFSILKNTYVEIREEPLSLRFLVFYLGREGVTTLFIDTQPGQPDSTVDSRLESDLRALVHNHLYTWRFSFYGESRVAIAPIPPVAPELPAMVRELRVGTAFDPELDLTPLVVDPHFEMYSGIEKGTPSPIPIQIRLFAETEKFDAYIEAENKYLGELLVPVERGDTAPPGKIIVSVSAGDYDNMRDFSYLPRDTRLDHTLILQVDEFWYLRRTGVRRAGTFRKQKDYLNGVTASTRGEITIRDWGIDPFGLFQRTEHPSEILLSDEPIQFELFRQTKRPIQFELFPRTEHPREPLLASGSEGKPIHHRRIGEFDTYGYRFDPAEENSTDFDFVDRVPFMWDFGFLLCKKRQWKDCLNQELPIWNKNHKTPPQTVNDVWEGLPQAIRETASVNAPLRPSWRKFLEACHQVAQAEAYHLGTPVPAFDLSAIAAQSFSCLVLEIWTSEIYQRLEKDVSSLNQKGGLVNFVNSVSTKKWNFDSAQKGLIDWLGNEDYQKDLFKT